MVNKDSGEQVKGTWLVDWAKIINKYIKDHPDQKRLGPWGLPV